MNKIHKTVEANSGHEGEATLRVQRNVAVLHEWAQCTGASLGHRLTPGGRKMTQRKRYKLHILYTRILFANYTRLGLRQNHLALPPVPDSSD